MTAPTDLAEQIIMTALLSFRPYLARTLGPVVDVARLDVESCDATSEATRAAREPTHLHVE